METQQQHNTNLQLQTTQQQKLQSLLPSKHFDKLSGDAQIALRNMTASVPMRQLDEPAQKQKIKELVAEICVLTGAVIPPEATLATLNIVRNFINNHYNFLTKEELYSAFELNVAGKLPENIKLWGAALNCQYIGAVLHQFVVYRHQLYGEVRQQMMKALPEICGPKELSRDERVEIIENEFRKYKEQADFEKQIIWLPAFMYDLMCALELIKQEDHLHYRERAVSQYKAEQASAMTRNISAHEMKAIGRVLSSGEWDMERTDAAARVTNIAKELCVKYFFANAIANGKQTIFEDCVTS
jgi:hypothetical protein